MAGTGWWSWTGDRPGPRPPPVSYPAKVSPLARRVRPPRSSMHVTWVPLALALAGASLARAGEPGWVWERACVPGPSAPEGANRIPGDSGAAHFGLSDSGFAAPARPARPRGAGPWFAPDTLRPPG